MNMPTDKYRSKFIAHRGESYDAPENTMSAIQLAWDRAVEIVEVDVHLTADNEICVIHDKDTLRTTGKKLIVRRSKMGELQKLDAGSWKEEKWAGEKIPTLKEALASVPENGKLIIEIKSDSSILDKLKYDTRNSGLRNDQIEIIAFNLQTLTRAKEIMPEFKMLWLFTSMPVLLQYLTGTNPWSVLKKLRRYNIDGVNIGNTRFFKKKLIERFTSEGYPVYTWTVNDPDRALELLKWGAEYVTTDKAAWMAEVLKDRE